MRLGAGVLAGMLFVSLQGVSSSSKSADCTENRTMPAPSQVNHGLLRDHPIVLISGLFNEGRTGDFKAFKQDLIDYYNVPPEQITIIKPSSRHTVSEDAVELNEQFREIQRSTGKTLIVFAHSKGGAATMLSLMEYQDLLPNVVQTAFLMQPAFGSQFATATSVMCTNPAGALISGCKPSRKYKEGLRSLKTPIVDHVFEMALEQLKSETHRLIDENVFYLRASASEKTMHLGTGHKIVFGLLKLFYGANDGAMVFNRQHLCGIGTDFELVVQGRHSSLVDGKQAPYETALTQQFVRYMVDTVGYDKSPDTNLVAKTDDGAGDDDKVIE